MKTVEQMRKDGYPLKFIDCDGYEATMVCLDYIAHDTWKKFFEQCKGLYVDETNAEIRDSEQDDKIIWKYNAERLYHA